MRKNHKQVEFVNFFTNFFRAAFPTLARALLHPASASIQALNTARPFCVPVHRTPSFRWSLGLWNVHQSGGAEE